MNNKIKDFDNSDGNNGTFSKEYDQLIEGKEFCSELSMSYMEYAMSVILSRAIPDIRDGFKDVQRRIIYSMYEEGNTYNNRFKKCAHTVGNVSGKYHPHGDSSIYSALVRMAQPFSTYMPIIQGQGNFGSVDGDSPAAHRYTEARLSKMSSLIIDNVPSSILTMRKNYDASLLEPVYMILKIPLVLVNGTKGIAVSVTSNVPSHRLEEVIDVIIYLLQSENYNLISYNDIKHLITGPDFPNYCLIDNFNLEKLYTTGQASVVTSSELIYNEKVNEILIIGLAHEVKKMKLIKSIVDCIQEKIINGIEDIIDESEGQNCKIKIILNANTNGNVVLRRLLKYTLCRNSIGFVFRFIVNNKPEIVPFVNVITNFISERIRIIKLKLGLENSNRLVHIEKIIALFIATRTSQTINIIKEILESESVESARKRLASMCFDISEIHHLLPKNIQKINVKEFTLTSLQIEYLLNTQIVKLNQQKTRDLEQIIKENTEKIEYNETIINNENNIKEIIIKEVTHIKNNFSKDRLCKITTMDKSLRIEDMEPEKDIILFLSTDQIINYQETYNFKVQKRGGKGRIIFEAKNICSIAMTSTHEDILLFTSFGYCYKINAFDIYYRGKTIMEIISLREGDNVISIKSLNFDKKYNNVLIFTELGLIKKHSTRDFHSFNKLGKRICIVDNNDKIIKIIFINTSDFCVLFSLQGRFICLEANSLREFVSRNTKGIKGIKLKENDLLKDVISIDKAEYSTSILLIDTFGNAKRLTSSLFLEKIANRNTIGVLCINKKYGLLSSCVKITSIRCKIIIATKLGKIMIINFNEIPETKRLNKGLKLVNLEKDDYIIFANTI